MARAEGPNDWLTRKEAADYLNKIGCCVSPRLLEKLAVNNNAGKGPAFRRVRERIIRYRRGELDTWAYRHTKDVK